MNSKSPAITLGHVHLKVRDLDRAIRFYVQTLGLAVSERVGDHYAFLSDGVAHHTVALQNVGDAAPDAPPLAVGLYHTAFEVPNKCRFARVYRSVLDAGVEAVAVNHGISWAMYFRDPDGNGVEIYTDTRREADGHALWQGMSLPISDAEIAVAATTSP